MSITLDLPPQIETLLRQRAETTGQDMGKIAIPLEGFAIAVLIWGLSLNNEDFFETFNGIQRGLDNFEQGQFSSLDDFAAQQNQKYGLTLEP